MMPNDHKRQLKPIDRWLSRIKRWLDRVRGVEGSTITPVTANRVYQTPLVLLRRLDCTYHDELTTRISHWVCVPRSPELQFDVVITCDRLHRSEDARLAGDITTLTVTHRIAVFRVSRTLVRGHRKKDQLLLADLDCVGSNPNRFPDGWADRLTDSIALQLKHRSLVDLQRLILWDNEQDRQAVVARWESILEAYAKDWLG